MGLDDFRFNADLAKKISKNSKNLNTKLSKLHTIMDEMNNAWPESMGDKKYVFDALNSAGKGIASVGTSYYWYADNISATVDWLVKQLPWGGLVASGKTVKFTKCTAKKPNSTKLKININELRNCGKELIALGGSIYDVELADCKRVAAGLSDTVTKLLNRKSESLSSLNQKLDKHSERIKKVGTTVVAICDKYEAAETKIKKQADQLRQGKAHIEYGDGTVRDIEQAKKQGWSYSLTSPGTYSLNKSIINQVDSARKIKVSGSFSTIATYDFFMNNIVNNSMYDQYSKKHYGNISSWWDGNDSVGCTAVALGTYLSLITGTQQKPKDFWTSAGVISYNQRTVNGRKLKREFYTRGKNGAGGINNELYDRIVTKGEPLIIRYSGRDTGPHSVVGIGIKEGADPKNIKNSDILVYDPVGGKVTTYDQTQAGKYPISSLEYFT